MDIRLKAMQTVAIVLAAGALLSQFLGSRGMSLEDPPWSQGARKAAVSDSRTAILGRCVENAQMIHDVYWATACMQVAEQQKAAHARCMEAELGREHCDRQFTPDDAPDCTLPPDRAATLNRAFELAEDRCVEESARAGTAVPLK